MIDRGARSLRGSRRLGVMFAGLLGALLAAAATPAPPPLVPASAPASLPAWTGRVNLYRAGVFTTQASWLYCTAADVQIIRNMVEGTEDHRGSAQTTYFDWMRTKNRYDLPLSAGVDPAGWTAGMRHFVDDRYRLVSSATFEEALRLAVERIRRTNLPVTLAVSHGDHGWVLHGFTATADPATTSDFEITSVNVTGPLWGRQSKNGYDMKPDTELTLDQLRTYFTPWHYNPLPMIWDGTFVSIQPVPVAGAELTPTPTQIPTPTPAATATTTPSATPSSAPTADETTRPGSSTALASTPPGGRADAPGTDRSGPDPGAARVALVVALAIVAVLVGARWKLRAR